MHSNKNKPDDELRSELRAVFRRPVAPANMDAETLSVLEFIRDNPGRTAMEVAKGAGVDMKRWKSVVYPLLRALSKCGYIWASPKSPAWLWYPHEETAA